MDHSTSCRGRWLALFSLFSYQHVWIQKEDIGDGVEKIAEVDVVVEDVVVEDVVVVDIMVDIKDQADITILMSPMSQMSLMR